MSEPNPPSRSFQLLELGVIAAVCASVVALAYLAVRSVPVTLSRFSGVAGIVWGVMFVVGVGVPWALSRR